MKLALEQTFIYGGQFYGPGLADVPDGDAADAISAKQSALRAQTGGQPAAAPTETVSDGISAAATVEDVDAQIAALEARKAAMLEAAAQVVAAEKEGADKAAGTDTPPATIPVVTAEITPVASDGEATETAIDPAILDKLAAAGFDTPEKRSAASDDDLLAVQGIGPATVAKIRAGG